ncbi:helix-turn-helix transcriptional regulator [Agrobacterium larrymoorei]|uniref:Response regulator transcription factor n=1 Tax=Agrobacterium larrymoorei TaxID=160699 RepID=A0A4D7DZC0_9HYPH|nr:response regulator transcription factor [Agrobacterium larrymoorei]QCI99456.1 response regulator transcription factor [Agrobacterium larrymoorei]QYA09002.1 response regulator transcription factor [Agrobacterium larrymoorei]WHA43649.1 response regulator transcription factor [Agrobacterium larrymoorei]
MFMVASRVIDAKQNNKILSTSGSILVVANADLFSECLVEALGKKFPACDVISDGPSGNVASRNIQDVKLVLLYKLSGAQLEDLLDELRFKHPNARIALVIDAIDMIETYLKQLVETRIIDGVLPLNLRLDVFLAAVDLLIKGGEHFPSALLGKLTAGPEVSSRTVYDTRAVVANRADALAAKKDEFSALTTREVQILDLLCKGTQNKIIADRLKLSENTVKVHVRNIYKKMNVRNRTEAASRFFHKDDATNDAGKWRN